MGLLTHFKGIEDESDSKPLIYRYNLVDWSLAAFMRMNRHQ